MNKFAIFVIAGIVMCLAFLINDRGIVFSSRVQLAVIVVLIALLLAAVLFSFGSMRGNFIPFAPNGLMTVGMAAALIF